MPSQHRVTPLSIRLSEAERQRLEAYAERAGKPVRRVIVEAITEKLDREGEPQPMASRIRDMSERVRRGELG